MKTAITIFSFILMIGFSSCEEDGIGMDSPEITIKNVSGSRVSFTASVSESAKDGTLYYALTRADDPAPTAEDIVEDKVYFTGNAGLKGRTSVLLSISQLAAGNMYYLYSVVEMSGSLSGVSARKEVNVQ